MPRNRAFAPTKLQLLANRWPSNELEAPDVTHIAHFGSIGTNGIFYLHENHKNQPSMYVNIRDSYGKCMQIYHGIDILEAETVSMLLSSWLLLLSSEKGLG